MAKLTGSELAKRINRVGANTPVTLRDYEISDDELPTLVGFLDLLVHDAGFIRTIGVHRLLAEAQKAMKSEH